MTFALAKALAGVFVLIKKTTPIPQDSRGIGVGRHELLRD